MGKLIEGDLVDENKFSLHIGIPVGTLRQMRADPASNGPPWFKLGKSVRYSLTAGALWLEGHRQDKNSLSKRVRRA